MKKVFVAPTKLPFEGRIPRSIFLAGSIDMGFLKGIYLRN
jgi:hypothetical protein